MKTLVKDGVSSYLLEDSVEVSLTADNMTVGNPAQFIVLDCNTSNITTHLGVNAPDDWTGGKYTFDGTSWAVNADWSAPTGEPPEYPDDGAEYTWNRENFSWEVT
jgi:hypothetical protein